MGLRRSIQSPVPTPQPQQPLPVIQTFSDPPSNFAPPLGKRTQQQQQRSLAKQEYKAIQAEAKQHHYWQSAQESQQRNIAKNFLNVYSLSLPIKKNVCMPEMAVVLLCQKCRLKTYARSGKPIDGLHTASNGFCTLTTVKQTERFITGR